MKRSSRKRLNLTITLVLFVFIVIVITFIVAGIVVFSLNNFGVITLQFEDQDDPGGNPIFLFFILFILCTIIGAALTAFLSKKALNPLRKIIEGTKKISGGDFDVHVDIKGIGELEELSHNFNKMADELSTIETLRADFVNNFSHEFKTPIVSIRGFAKLIKESDITEEEKEEYLNIIIAESERLAELSTNVLTISKYESIEIITDKKPFRLDEQIRRAILLFEPKWAAKNIEMNVNLDEITYTGNADLIQQIWINLLDNAIKFSKNGGHIVVWLSEWNGKIRFMIDDDGSGMTEETKTKIFEKFFQGDNSHKTSGNGLGLTLVNRIVKLCNGSIEVHSEPEKGSVFIVLLTNDN